jgi:hypothetical protein
MSPNVTKWMERRERNKRHRVRRGDEMSRNKWHRVRRGQDEPESEKSSQKRIRRAGIIEVGSEHNKMSGKKRNRVRIGESEWESENSSQNCFGFARQPSFIKIFSLLKLHPFIDNHFTPFAPSHFSDRSKTSSALNFERTLFVKSHIFFVKKFTLSFQFSKHPEFWILAKLNLQTPCANQFDSDFGTNPNLDIHQIVQFQTKFLQPWNLLTRRSFRSPRVYQSSSNCLKPITFSSLESFSKAEYPLLFLIWKPFMIWISPDLCKKNIWLKWKIQMIK